MRSSRTSSLLRGTSTALLATFAALLGHVSAGGQMPGAIGILVPLVLSTMVSVLLAGRRLSLTRLLLAVSASQFLFHELFVLGAITPEAGLGVHQHGLPLALPLALPLPLPAGETVLTAPDHGMWLGHIAAAVVTALVLHRGERLLTRVVGIAGLLSTWLVGIVRARTAIEPMLPRPLCTVPAHVVECEHTGIQVVRQQPRRGPPLLSII